MLEQLPKNLPEIASQTPNLLDSNEVMAYTPRADFFLWFTPTVSRLAIITALTPIFLFFLGYVGILKQLIFPLTIAYLNSLKPFLQMGISQSFAPVMAGLHTLIYLCFFIGVLPLLILLTVF